MSMMHVHAPLCLTVATGTAWTFGIFQVYSPEFIQFNVLSRLSVTLTLINLAQITKAAANNNGSKTVSVCVAPYYCFIF